ncbi:hypothetical protein [Rhizobium leguminosarum]|uniref:hypothetical protein n=1 Tax=Rhizobium leguminosarum TaxID=384 RepID=UPI00055A36AF|nr:hypothetical protein [Rhizobium leguminosarum]
MTIALKKLVSKPPSNRELDRLAEQFHSYPVGVAQPISMRLEAFHPVSVGIMKGYVVQYVSMTRPTITGVYRSYQAEIARINNEQSRRAKPLPTLSMYIFRSAIDSLDPFVVMAGRFGFDAAMRHLRNFVPRYPVANSTPARPLAVAF